MGLIHNNCLHSIWTEFLQSMRLEKGLIGRNGYIRKARRAIARSLLDFDSHIGKEVSDTLCCLAYEFDAIHDDQASFCFGFMGSRF